MSKFVQRLLNVDKDLQKIVKKWQKLSWLSKNGQKISNCQDLWVFVKIIKIMYYCPNFQKLTKH